jgi:hypothetical protein
MALKIDGADAAIVGYTDDPFRVVYDYERLVDVFANKGDRESGIEWIEFNIIRGLAYMSESERPVIVYPADADEVENRADECG